MWITRMLPANGPYDPPMPRRQERDNFSVDANGFLTERIVLGGQDVIIHYADVPESDITTVNGLRCTTPLRTVIDLAPELDTADLERMIRDCLERRLFSLEDAMVRTAEPDMLTLPGARVLRQTLARWPDTTST